VQIQVHLVLLDVEATLIMSAIQLVNDGILTQNNKKHLFTDKKSDGVFFFLLHFKEP
jgi:hypothetical protein